MVIVMVYFIQKNAGFKINEFFHAVLTVSRLINEFSVCLDCVLFTCSRCHCVGLGKLGFTSSCQLISRAL